MMRSLFFGFLSLSDYSSQESLRAHWQKACLQREQYGNCTIRRPHRTNDSFMILVVACSLLYLNDTYAFPFLS